MFFLSETLNHLTFLGLLQNAILLELLLSHNFGSISFSTDNKGHDVQGEFWSSWSIKTGDLQVLLLNVRVVITEVLGIQGSALAENCAI